MQHRDQRSIQKRSVILLTIRLSTDLEKITESTGNDYINSVINVGGSNII
jgi:hypothetical protein